MAAQGSRQVNGRTGKRIGGRLDGGQERQAKRVPDGIAGLMCRGAVRYPVGACRRHQARHGQAGNAQDQRFQPVRGLERQLLSPRDDVDGARGAAPAPERARHAVQFDFVRRTQVKDQRACFVHRRCAKRRRLVRIRRHVPDGDLGSLGCLTGERGNAAPAGVFFAGRRVRIPSHDPLTPGIAKNPANASPNETVSTDPASCRRRGGNFGSGTGRPRSHKRPRYRPGPGWSEATGPLPPRYVVVPARGRASRRSFA